MLNRLYYTVKPIIPPRVRLALRRWLARSMLARHRGTWPILPGSEARPAGWSGWPEGKDIALVLTHDVERQAGVERIPALIDLEAKWGFRSAFHLVPEGSYRVPAQLRERIVASGCEVAVHDLNHDGKLYRSRRDFAKKAKRINCYLKDWNARGFRSGFMLHRLDWLTELEIQYDASTFDTDPFEPQPDGVGTIFPFWVHGAGGRGYWELPYTLTQDYSLFAVLGETGIDIWKRKVDWIASHRGMVLLDTHPDYMEFGPQAPVDGKYSAARYEEFLAYLTERYAGRFWHALPHELASFMDQVGSR